MEINYLTLPVSGMVALFLGFIWYNPNVLGKIWMKESKLTDAQISSGNIIKIYGLTFIFAMMIAMIMHPIVIHQYGALGMIGGIEKIAKPSYTAFMNDYGNDFRSFKHGAFHGFFVGLMLALPIFATNALFERKSWKYILINGGYWVALLTIVGGIVCGWK
ncbi:DUF1761 family protein [Flavobacterium sp. NST-5]|uniref:DUF1761 family protein n=1 Tax=Flavobacterium ichthyis TaxID=2698827 RepID=A0ABW9Z439_9FLAO|nr:DUF1761 domain-containing protein [Flavobacterium ichthyis]NBL63595.1 DUF1761 family protein [Flavobacterium ichthyis]